VTTPATLEGLRHLASGKVRDLYEVDDRHLLLVASDRISAFDVVLDDQVPAKGEVLTGLTRFWLELLGDLVPNHLAGWRASELPAGARHLAGRAMLVRRLQMLPVECVARGYLAGSGWKDYQATGAVCGIPLPRGLRQADRLPAPDGERGAPGAPSEGVEGGSVQIARGILHLADPIPPLEQAEECVLQDLLGLVTVAGDQAEA